MKKIAFEGEFFVGIQRKEGPEFFGVPSSVPKDECGYLAEVRGDASDTALKAAHLFLAEKERVANLLAKEKRPLELLEGVAFLSNANRTLKLVMREFGKAPAPAGLRGNIYGKFYSLGRNPLRVGLHIHFSDVTEWKHEKYTERTVRLLNFPKIIQALDKEFAPVIKEAKRLPGFYEIKPSYGFEYRSLPGTIDPLVVARFLETLEW